MAVAGERKAAQLAGLTRYFTGRPCINGHIAERSVTNKACTVCLNEDRARRHVENWDAEEVSRRVYRERNADKLRAYASQYVCDNREKINEKNKAYRAANPEWARDCHLRNTQRNKDKINARARAWRALNKEKQTFYANQKRARKIAATPIIRADLAAVFNEELLLIYTECRALSVMSGVPHNVDHIFPLSRGGVHAPWNLRIILRSENQSKKDRWPDNEPVDVFWHGELVSRLINVEN